MCVARCRPVHALSRAGGGPTRRSAGPDPRRRGGVCVYPQHQGTRCGLSASHPEPGLAAVRAAADGFTRRPAQGSRAHAGGTRRRWIAGRRLHAGRDGLRAAVHPGHVDSIQGTQGDDRGHGRRGGGRGSLDREPRRATDLRRGGQEPAHRRTSGGHCHSRQGRHHQHRDKTRAGGEQSA